LPDTDILGLLGGEKPNTETKPIEEEEEGLSEDKVDSEVLNSMLTADGADGNFRKNKKPEPSVTEDEKATISGGKVKEKLGKYSKEFVKDVIKNPEKYTVETSRGTLTIKEAIKQGWDPKTGDFVEEKRDKSEERIAALGDSDQKAVRDLMDPSNAGIPAAEAEEDGLDSDSPMIRKPPAALEAAQQQEAGAAAVPPGAEQAPAEGGQQMDPEQLKALLGGLM
jgi:hypothetical protein